jgi:hypothetical protein
MERDLLFGGCESEVLGKRNRHVLRLPPLHGDVGAGDNLFGRVELQGPDDLKDLGLREAVVRQRATEPVEEDIHDHPVWVLHRGRVSGFR